MAKDFGFGGGLFLVLPGNAAGRMRLLTHSFDPDAAGVDIGPVPESQMLTFLVRLKPTAARGSALEELIAEQLKPGSANYRRWVSTEEFAAQFGVSDERITAVKAWLESQGLAVTETSAGKTRLTVTGAAGRVQAAFALRLRRFSGSDGVYFANTADAPVPSKMAGLLSGTSGLSGRPSDASLTLRALGAYGLTILLSGSVRSDGLATLEEAVDANQASMLTLLTEACSAEFSAADYEDYRAVLQQAEAQGMTVLATSGCKGSGVAKAGAFRQACPRWRRLRLCLRRRQVPLIA